MSEHGQPVEAEYMATFFGGYLSISLSQAQRIALEIAPGEVDRCLDWLLQPGAWDAGMRIDIPVLKDMWNEYLTW